MAILIGWRMFRYPMNIDLPIGTKVISPMSIARIDTLYGVFHASEGDLIADQLKRYSAHTRNELSMIRDVIRDGDNIVDIGAHIGTFSIPFARFNTGQRKVDAFEAMRA